VLEEFNKAAVEFGITAKEKFGQKGEW
jgi:hypothetical protein